MQFSTLQNHFLPMIDISRPYLSRDLSWLSFNHRVLLEAKSEEVPLYERISFLSIFSANLDEFFRVRVAAIRTLIELKKETVQKHLDFDPEYLLIDILERVQEHQREFGLLLREQILPALRREGIHLYYYEAIRPEHGPAVTQFFLSRVLSFLQPVFIPEGKTLFLENGALYLILKIQKETDGSCVYAYLNIPSGQLPRFVQLPSPEGTFCYLFLDDIIRENVGRIFPGYQVKECFSVKLTRDAELTIDDEFSGSLVQKIQKQLDKRNLGVPTRFLYESGMPEEMLTFLKQAAGLTDAQVVEGGRYHNLRDLSSFPNPLAPRLVSVPLPPLPHTGLDAYPSIFEAMDDNDRMLHLPYHSYDYILRFFNEAAIDPTVKEMFVTLYRIAAHSLIANALISAARNGKKVFVFVEVKARFDEDNNIRWARKMKEAGVKIVYSIPGIKVHAKVALIRRQMPNGKWKRYAFLGTGNFNESTARVYTDHALLTTHAGIAKELESVFAYLTKRKNPKPFRHLLVAQFNMTDRFQELIDREIVNAQQGLPARMIIKLNNLEEKGMIDKLYQASRSGVKVDLIIRGICCLIPGLPVLSENIRVIRLVDRFLEHSRVFIFYNNGQEEIYLASADWMSRNLHRRVEVGFPIYDQEIKRDLEAITQLQLADNCKAVRLDAHQRHQTVQYTEGDKLIRAQHATYDFIKKNKINSEEPAEVVEVFS